jgi:hypothetical protein
MKQFSVRAKAAVIGGTAVLVIGLLPLATGVAAAGPSVTPFTGGTGIQSNTARIGGSGAWTTLTGPVIVEDSPGFWPAGETISMALPANFEWNAARTTPPSVTGCQRVSSPIVYSGAGLTITLNSLFVGPLTNCTVDFGGILQVRPITSSLAAGSGGTVTLTFVNPTTPMPGVFPGGAGVVSMVVSPAPTPTPTPGPAGPPTVVRATGGTGIQSNTALTGGSGAWTTLTGPTITEGGLGAWPIGTRITLALPANFQWNQARTTPLSVSGCDRNATAITYSGNDIATVTLAARSGASQMALCTISFGTTLQVRPLNSASSAGTGGPITLTFVDPTLPMPSVFPGGAGQVTMVTSAPPVGPMTLAITSPTMNNNAINWGEGLDITTTGSPGTVYQVQVSPTDPATGNAAWETLTDSSAVVRNFTIGSSGTSTVTPPYTPIRNFWYRSISGTTVSNIVRITVRQTIALRSSVPTGRTISRGTSVTFTATVRPARPELQRAVVVFELSRRSGSSWVVDRTTRVTIDSNGVASWRWSASSSGSFRVRAQAQPTPVNSNSFWSPFFTYTVN